MWNRSEKHTKMQLHAQKLLLPYKNRIIDYMNSLYHSIDQLTSIFLIGPCINQKYMAYKIINLMLLNNVHLLVIIGGRLTEPWSILTETRS